MVSNIIGGVLGNGFTDGVGTSAEVGSYLSLALGSDGYLIFSDSMNYRVRITSTPGM